MSLREEVKEAMAEACKKVSCYGTAAEIRKGLACMPPAASAALGVIDTYVEVEVVRNTSSPRVLHDLTGEHNPLSYAQSYSGRTGDPRITIYIKKEKPAPTVEELARATEQRADTYEKALREIADVMGESIVRIAKEALAEKP